MTEGHSLVPHQPATPETYEQSLERRRDLIRRQLMPPGATDDDLELFLAKAASKGLDPLANQIRAIRFDREGEISDYDTWEGLLTIARRTGDYQGRTKPPIEYTADGVTWVPVWLSQDAPAAARAGIYVRGYRDAQYGYATYATWGMMPDPKGWSDTGRKRRDGSPVRTHNGKRVPKPGWWQPGAGAEHQLAKQAFRIVLKASFQPDVLRKATMAAARGLSREERLQLASELLGRPVGSYNELDPGEASMVFDVLTAERQDSEAVEAEVEEGADLFAPDDADPFDLPEHPGVEWSAEATGIMKGSAGSEGQAVLDQTERGGAAMAEPAPASRPAAPAEQAPEAAAHAAADPPRSGKRASGKTADLREAQREAEQVRKRPPGDQPLERPGGGEPGTPAPRTSGEGSPAGLSPSLSDADWQALVAFANGNEEVARAILDSFMRVRNLPADVPLDPEHLEDLASKTWKAR